MPNLLLIVLKSLVHKMVDFHFSTVANKWPILPVHILNRSDRVCDSM